MEAMEVGTEGMNVGCDFVMSERIHLGSVSKPEGALWFTLVVESPIHFYVEVYNDSPRSFLVERTKIVRVGEFGRHDVNGVSLSTLVAEKFNEINFQMPQNRPSDSQAA